jgi:hypothetical protein
MAFVPDPSAMTFEEWAETISGLSGPDAEFEADANGDGVANGLAFLLGSQDANTDAKDLLPAGAYLPGSLDGGGSLVPGEYVVAFRRSDDAAETVPSAVDYTTTLDAWTTPGIGDPGITITVDDDFYEPGIDRVEVRLSETLAPDGSLYLRLKAGP